MDPATASIACFVNGAASTLPAGTTVARLVERLALRPEVVAIEIDARLVPRAAWSSRALVDGERIEVVTLVGGG